MAEAAVLCLGFFGVCLPLAMLLWAELLACHRGALTEPKWPYWVRALAAQGFLVKIGLLAQIVLGGGIVWINSIPAAVVVRDRVDLIEYGCSAAFFLVEGLIVIGIVRAARQ
jgi:hypothetical protein